MRYYIWRVIQLLPSSIRAIKKETTLSPVELIMVPRGSTNVPTKIKIPIASGGKPSILTIIALPMAPPPGTEEIAVADKTAKNG